MRALLDLDAEQASAPVPLVPWSASDQEWRAARRHGCGASDVNALLGFDRYRSPWQVWAEKTDHPLAPAREESEATKLGKLLEEWLLTDGLAEMMPGVEGCLTPARLYTHPQYPWRLCSPDGCVGAPHSMARFNEQLVQCKTAGLVTGRAHGWTDSGIPLGYELQARWEMHVMDASVNHMIALVAGRGLCHYPIHRDLDVETDLLEQVDQWWRRHIIGGDEPPLTGRDASVVAALYPRAVRRATHLDDTDALTHWQAYRAAHQDQLDAATRKAEASVALKALLGDAEVGLVYGRPVATWGERKARVDWERMARELAGRLGQDIEPIMDDYRGPPTRAFNIKE